MTNAKIKFTKKFVSGLLKGLMIQEEISTVHPEEYLKRYQKFIAKRTVLGGTLGTSKYIVINAELSK